MRRETKRRRRAGLVASAAIGATALFAGPAQAATFQVTSAADAPADACDTDCTLRDAIAAANATSDADTITFADDVTDIRLTEDQLSIFQPVAIDGGGDVTISGDNDDNGTDAGDFRIFALSGVANGSTLSGLTLTHGGGSYVSTQYDYATQQTVATVITRAGGAVSAGGRDLEFTDVTVTDSSPGSTQAGGAIDLTGDLVLRDSTVSGNTAGRGGGVYVDSSSTLTVDHSTIADNTATGTSGGGIDSSGQVEVTGSTISGNTAASTGGAVFATGKYGRLEVSDSTISGNTAARGGGVFIASSSTNGKYDSNTVDLTRSAITGNTATGSGGGVGIGFIDNRDQVTLDHSTVSGNESKGSGGGLQIDPGSQGINGAVTTVDSTISGNTAATAGGGVAVGVPAGASAIDAGSLDLQNSTVAANTAAKGGGVYLNSYVVDPDTEETGSATVALTSTIVGDNTGGDLDRADGSAGGGFDLAFSLVEAPGDAPLFQSEGDHNLVAVDPQLGALADNGGPTRTHLPKATSPAIDAGDAPARLDTDQRGRPRTLDGAPANPEGGDGTDIGAVEIARVPAPAPAPAPEASASPAPSASASPSASPAPSVSPTPIPVIVTRVKPAKLVVKVSKSDTTSPYTFKTTGRVVPPAGLTREEACGTLGFASVQVKHRHHTVSTRRSRVRANCRFTSVVTFRHAKRFKKAKRLTFVVRFGGNARLEPITAKAKVRHVG